MTRLNMSSDMYAPTLDDVADAFGFPAKRRRPSRATAWWRP